MESFGSVVAILNEFNLLLKRETALHINQDVMVFGRLEDQRLKEAGVEALDYPKGRVKIRAKQGNNIYLAARYKIAERDVPVSTAGPRGL